MKPSSRSLLLATVAMTAASLGSVFGASRTTGTTSTRLRPQVQRMPPPNAGVTGLAPAQENDK